MKSNNNPNRLAECEKESSLASILIAAIGIGYLFPFSALTQPVDYWNSLFPYFNIEFVLTSVFMWTNLLVLGSLVLFCGEPSYLQRITYGFIGQFFALIIVPSSYFLHLDEVLIGFNKIDSSVFDNINLYWQFSNALVILAATAFAAIATAVIDSCAISFSCQVLLCYSFTMFYLLLN